MQSIRAIFSKGVQMAAQFMGSPWTTKKIGATVGVIGAIVIGFVLLSGGTEESTDTAAVIPTVKVGTIASLTSGDTATYVGTVRSVSEADIQAERGGRVTSVRVTAGTFVPAGTIIATLENASEQAAVLQARGAYEGALAAGQQSQVGVSEAATALERTKAATVTSFSSAYNTVLGVVKTDIDVFFANPQSPLPGLRIDGQGDTQTINAARVALNTTLAAWQSETATLSTAGNLDAALASARRYTGETINLVDLLIGALSRNSSGNAADDTARKADIARLTGVRSALLGLQSSLQNDVAALASARDAVARAEISAGNTSGPSAANAQITQALGSLRAAQANLEKTILRTPIAGTVEVLRIKTGDFLSPQTSVARVAGGQGLEISVFIGEFDRDRFAIGDTVSVNGTATGTVVTIAPAIDPATRKSEIKIATAGQGLVNGDTVSVALANATTTSAAAARIQVPITAIKFTDTDGVVFTVENNQLKAVPVTLGPINGSFVTIESGIDATTEFVLDARGKTEGETVEVIRD